MKKLLLVLAIGAFAACGDGAQTESTESDATSTADSATLYPDTTTTMTDTSTIRTDSVASPSPQ